MRKKILLVRNAYSFDFGGGERYSINLAKELIKVGYEPIVATRHSGILALAKENLINTRKMPWWSSQNLSGKHVFLTPFYLIWIAYTFFWYCRAIKASDIDILHLQSRDDFIAGTIAGKILHKKVIWTDHADLKYIFKNIGTFYKNPVGKLVYYASKYADKIIIVSKNELKLVQENLGSKILKNTEVIYNGIADTEVKPKRLYDANIPIFALTSRLVSTKGIGELLKASHLLDNNGYEHRVILLGEGPEKRDFKMLAGKSVEFLGFPDDALSYIAGADIFVHPTYNEAFSLSLVEAAMLGKPVITTRVGGNPEIITDSETGLLIPVRDANALYDAMLYAINNPNKMKKYGENLRKSYLENFQFNRIVKDMIIPLYNKTV